MNRKKVKQSLPQIDESQTARPANGLPPKEHISNYNHSNSKDLDGVLSAIRNAPKDVKPRAKTKMSKA